MRPYSLLVPISDARTVLAKAMSSICAVFSFGRPDLKAPKKSSPNNSGRDEYLSCLGNMLLDILVYCKESDHDIDIKQILTTYSGLLSRKNLL